MAEDYFSIKIANLHPGHRLKDSKAVSHRSLGGKEKFGSSNRCKSQDRFTFEHNQFTHGKIIRANHNIPYHQNVQHIHKHHDDHSRTVTIKKRVVSENILLDSFPSN